MDCCSPDGGSATVQTDGALALIGHPNVGKSVLFQRLTGRYVTVANYPGTTVQVARGTAQFMADTAVLDTPGIVAFPPHSEDERVAARVLLDESLRAIVQVADAKKLRRSLLLTVQLAELGLPIVLALNMMDEADSAGFTVDCDLLASLLDLPVVPTVATRGSGVDELIDRIRTARGPDFRLPYPSAIEDALDDVCPELPEAPIDSRALGLLWLTGDETTDDWVGVRVDELTHRRLAARRTALASTLGEPPSLVIQRARLQFADQAVASALSEPVERRASRVEKLGRITTHPVLGWPILAAILYGIYWFVGVFGAGRLVGLLEEDLFGSIINPWVTEWVTRLIPVELIQDFLVGEYGLWTMGMTYAFALILPIVTTFFLAFSILEDTGYLPRLSVLCNRMFAMLGLNGKAVLPMVLGLGCVTMATMTTRILETRRERMLAIFLLALAIPCSAQLGVVLGMLGSVSFGAMLIWSAVVLAVLLIVGALAARLMPGDRSPLLLELPPLRLPVLSNVVVKTVARIEWYLREVVPLFLAATAFLFVLDRTGALGRMIDGAAWLVTGWLGLPAEAGAAFLVGFLRRDFGATGLFVLDQQGQLVAEQIVVAMVTITLFVPCVASVLMIGRERGMRTAIAITALIFPLAFLVGGILHRVLVAVGWGA
ncbi:MAG: ferrous iron transport protein B [Gaiellales bacterium]